MTLKKFVSAPFVVAILLTMFSCGSDEVPITQKLTPDVTKEDLLGYWHVVSINDNPPLAFIHAYEPPDEVPPLDTDETVLSIANTDVSDEQDEYETDIDNFYFDFATDGTWTLNAQFRTTLPLPVEDVPDTDPPAIPFIDGANNSGGHMIYGKVEIIVQLSGTYSITEGPMLSLITKEKELSLTAVDEGTFKSELALRHSAIRDSYLKKFKASIITPLRQTYVTLEDNLLNLGTPGGRTKMRLEK